MLEPRPEVKAVRDKLQLDIAVLTEQALVDLRGVQASDPQHLMAVLVATVIDYYLLIHAEARNELQASNAFEVGRRSAMVLYQILNSRSPEVVCEALGLETQPRVRGAL